MRLKKRCDEVRLAKADHIKNFLVALDYRDSVDRDISSRDWILELNLNEQKRSQAAFCSTTQVELKLDYSSKLVQVKF